MKKFLIVFITVISLVVCCEPDENPFVLTDDTEIEQNDIKILKEYE